MIRFRLPNTFEYNTIYSGVEPHIGHLKLTSIAHAKILLLENLHASIQTLWKINFGGRIYVCLYVQMSALAGAQQLLYIHKYLQTHTDY